MASSKDIPFTHGLSEGRGTVPLALVRKVFSKECHFLTSVGQKEQLASFGDVPEIAFAGRSNVGKSSLINALVSRRLLARTSSMPGRTQCLNFFRFDELMTFVDLPGYGYGKASKKDRRQWNDLMNVYLQTRPELQRIFLLMDSRIELKKADSLFMDMCDRWAISFQLVMTKCDGLKPEKSALKEKELLKVASAHMACVPWVTQTSSKTGLGLEELRQECVRLALGQQAVAGMNLPS